MALTALPVYAFPLDAERRRDWGSAAPERTCGRGSLPGAIGGPADPLVRASVRIKGSVTLEVILASLLFAFAHVSWSLSPLHFKADIFQVIYAFVLGTIQGIAYQRTRSILYPMLMHSISNVFMVGGGYLFAALLP